MPSQEDYLDNLLKDLNGEQAGKKSDKQNVENEIQTSINDIEALLNSVEFSEPEETAASQPLESSEAPDIEEVQSMSQEEIERLLASGSENQEKENQAESPDAAEEEDIMNLLAETDDADLQEIHALLQKSDNNEAVETNQESLQQGEEEAQPETVFDRKKERIAQKQAKRASKEARKAEKKTARGLKRAKKTKTADEDAQIADAVPDIEGAAIDAADMKTEPSEQTEYQEDMSDVAGLFEAMDAIDAGKLSENEENDTEELLDITGLEELGAGTQQTTKKGLFSRFLDMLTEEDEDEENEEIKLSEENKEILKEMAQEKGKKKAGKKRKKGKAESEEGEEADGGGESKKPQKAKKEKKPKKEKTPKIEEVQEPQKKLSSRRILLVALICLSFGLSIIIIASISGDFMSKQEGRKAYYNGDYQSCYQNLFGKELNESETVMYCKAESILRIRLWLREYELLAEEGSETEALDSLIQSVHDYPTLYDYSVQWNAANEVAQGYAEILNKLSEKYQLTEEQAKEIGNIADDTEYTILVTAIAQGTSFDDLINSRSQENPQESAGQEPAVQEPQLADVLPEENELPEENFVDNNRQ